MQKFLRYESLRQIRIERSSDGRKMEKLIANPSIVHKLINVFQLTMVARNAFYVREINS